MVYDLAVKKGVRVDADLKNVRHICECGSAMFEGGIGGEDGSGGVLMYCIDTTI
jgi:hypothetical protein